MNTELAAIVRTEVAETLSTRLAADERSGKIRLSADDQREYARKLTIDVFRRLVRESVTNGTDALTPTEEDEIEQYVVDSLFGLGRLERLLNDPDIENVNANGCDVVWVRYSDGRRERVGPIASSDDELVELIRTAAARFGSTERRFDMGSPILHLQLPDGSRMFAVMAVSQRPGLSIRRHRLVDVTLDDLVRLGTMTQQLAHFLAACVRARLNIIICGGTGVGKTTLLRALASVMDPDERLFTVEDARELGLERMGQRHQDVMAFEARDANVEGEGAITMSTLVKAALRGSPDRVIVGEVRGQEIIDMLNAMNQGNDGSLCTIHSNSSEGCFQKIATYAAQSTERIPLDVVNLYIATAINLVVFVDQDPATHTRFVASVREVTGADGNVVLSNEVFAPGPDGRAIVQSPLSQATRTKLLRAGYDARSLEGPWAT